LSFFEGNFSLKLRIIQKKLNARSQDTALQDIVLTHIVEHLSLTGALEHLVFKGGSMLRRTIIGVESRFSGDLDFTIDSEGLANVQHTVGDLVSLIPGEIAGLKLDIDSSSDVRAVTHGNTHVLSVGYTLPNGRSGRVKVELDHRAEPVLPPVLLEQRAEFKAHVGGQASNLRCLQIEEIIGEKIRAAYQRIRIRDLYDLVELGNHPFNEDLARKIAVLKMWEAPLHNDSFSGGKLLGEIRARAIRGDYEGDRAELMPFLPENERIEVSILAQKTADRYGFLGRMTELERVVSTDLRGLRRDAFELLRNEAREMARIEKELPSFR